MISTSGGSTCSICACHPARNSRHLRCRTMNGAFIRVWYRLSFRAPPRKRSTSRRQTARFVGVKSSGGGLYLRMTISSGFSPESHSVQSPTNTASESAQQTHSVRMLSRFISIGFWHVTQRRLFARSSTETPPRASIRRFISSVQSIAPTITGWHIPFMRILATSRKEPHAKALSPAVTTVVFALSAI